MLYIFEFDLLLSLDTKQNFFDTNRLSYVDREK